MHSGSFYFRSTSSVDLSEIYRQKKHISISVSSTLCVCLPHVAKSILIGRAMSSGKSWNYETLAVSMPSEFVAHVELNRPNKGNAMNKAFWR